MATTKVPAQLFRSALFERESVNPTDRTVKLSVSSDEPYERFFGTEILSHKSDAVRLKRLQTAGAVLFNHNRDDHLGRVISAAVDGSKLNVIVKFGKGALATEKFQDVQDGILGEASIGYEIHKMEEDADEKTFTATDWEPYECSFVTVPADTSVGMGREMQTREVETTKHGDGPPPGRNPPRDEGVPSPVDKKETTNKKAMADTPTPEPAPKIDIVAENQKAVADFKARQKKIFEYVGAIKQPNWREIGHKIAMKHTADHADFNDFRDEYLNSVSEVQPVETPDPKIGMSKKERKQFSVKKLILEAFSTGRLTGLEKEACEASREQLRKAGDNTLDTREGFTLPEDMSVSNMAEDHDLGQNGLQRVMGEVRTLKRGLVAGTQNLGGYLIGTDLLTGSIIEYLRNRTIFAQLGIRTLDGLVGNVAIPRVTGTSTVYWLAEAASVTASAQAFGLLTLTPHRMGSDTFYTKQLLNQASLSVEAFVREDLAAAQAVELDRVYINGSGLAGEPQGVFNTTGVGTISFSAAATYAKFLTIESDIATANADVGTQFILTTPAARAKLKNAVMFTSTASPLWGGLQMDDTINGYSAYVSNNVPSNKLIQGVASEFIAARWAGLDVVVDPYSLKKTEQIEVTMHQWADCGIRHPLAFEISTDSAAQ